MRIIPRVALGALVLLLPLRAVRGGLHASLNGLAHIDTTLNIWVIFRDKPQFLAKPSLSGRAALRRRRAGFPASVRDDYPVSPDYVGTVERLGAVKRHIFKWGNAASFSVHSTRLEAIASLGIAKQVRAVATYPVAFGQGFLRKGPVEKNGPSLYGRSYTQLSIIGVPQAHAYLSSKGLSPGTGVVVGVFDEGFFLGHPCFAHVVANNTVIADSDFVENSPYPYVDYADHGTQTMALVGGYDAGNFVGVAWAARFIVARTEQGYDSAGTEYERHVEEDNWAAAMVWAESLGVDIVTSSVAYRTDFTSPDTDYTYADMDGQTTIIARAAQGALDRGVIIVNAMGNESWHGANSYTYGTLASPADVEDVISVGGITSDLRLSSFSGSGPTADGRIKPDCVAMASGVCVPSTQGYAQLSGTSFSTPMVAGIVALVKQCFPAASPNAIRQRLYTSCSFVPAQDSVDNVYGSGIPDALLACLDSLESYVLALDTLHRPVAGAEVYAGGRKVAVSDSFGAAVVSLAQSELPETLTIVHEYFLPAFVVVDSLRKRARVTLDSGSVLYVRVCDTSWASLANAVVYAKGQSDAEYRQYAVDTSGVAAVARKGVETVVLYASAYGYLPSSDTSIQYVSLADSVRLALYPRPVSHFAVYPNVLSLREISANKSMTIDFFASGDLLYGRDRECVVTVRTMNGDLVWKYAAFLTQDRPICNEQGEPLTWDCRSRSGGTVAPGVYFLVVHYGSKTYKKKLLITG